MNIIELQKIINKYPLLFPNKDCIHIVECHSGWYGLLDDLCDKITKMINFIHNLEDVDRIIEITQAKEKFGGIRVYTGLIHESLYDQVNNLIRITEDKSYTICEYCGKDGSLRKIKWWKTLCNECAKENYYL